MGSEVVLFALLAVMIVFMFMNNKKRKKQADELQAGIAVGTWVMLTSGIYGKVTTIDSDRITIETTPGSSISVNKLAVRQIEPTPESPVKKVAEKSAPAKKPAAKTTAAKKPATKTSAK
jgi:preprotein translocase subunit YajC